MRCNVIDPNTAILLDSHVFDPNSSDPLDVRCTTCGCCQRHCSGKQCQACGLSKHGICRFCNQCTSCCHCVICLGDSGHLLDTIELLCRSCRRCEGHCVCPKCKSCSKKRGTFCTYCGDCNDCCSSGKCGAFGRDYPIPPADKPLTKYVPNRFKELRSLSNPRLIGVEIEVNGIPKDGLKRSRLLYEALQKWQDAVVRDGSIGDQPTAFELNVQPSGGDLFLNHIRDLTDGLHQMKAKPNDNCGVHVHIDASDFEVYDLNRLIRLYAKSERAIFDLCHPRRLNCSYALVCGKYYVDNGVKANPAEFRQRLVSKLYYEGKDLTNLEKLKNDYCRYNYDRDYKSCSAERKKVADEKAISNLAAVLKKEKAHKYRNIRYKALNLHSYFLRHTIEFRHHEQAVDFENLTGWSMVCQELVSAAYRMTQRQIEALPRNSRRTLIALMPQRLHPYLIETWKKNDAIRKANINYREIYQTVWATSITANQVEEL